MCVCVCVLLMSLHLFCRVMKGGWGRASKISCSVYMLLIMFRQGKRGRGGGWQKSKQVMQKNKRENHGGNPARHCAFGIVVLCRAACRFSS